MKVLSLLFSLLLAAAVLIILLRPWNALETLMGSAGRTEFQRTSGQSSRIGKLDHRGERGRSQTGCDHLQARHTAGQCNARGSNAYRAKDAHAGK